MIKPVFEDSLIKDLYLTDEIRYIEFSHKGEFHSCVNHFRLTESEILYQGEHRIDENKWIIVLKEVGPPTS